MEKGQTVIFNNDYIEQIIRHKDITQRKYQIENMPQEKQKLKQKLDAWEQLLEKAECFQGIIREVKNKEIEKLATIVTMEGTEYPAKHLQVIF